jgi:transposase-like protein
MLVLALGFNEAASKLGLKPNTLRVWSRRFKWRVQPQKQSRKPTVTSVQPAQALEGEMVKLGNETRLSFAKSFHRMAKDSESVSLRESPYVHKAVQGASIVHGWDRDKDKGNNILNVAVLLGSDPDKAQDSLGKAETKQLPSQSNNQVIDLD